MLVRLAESAKVTVGGWSSPAGGASYRYTRGLASGLAPACTAPLGLRWGLLRGGWAESWQLALLWSARTVRTRSTNSQPFQTRCVGTIMRVR